MHTLYKSILKYEMASFCSERERERETRFIIPSHNIFVRTCFQLLEWEFWNESFSSYDSPAKVSRLETTS